MTWARLDDHANEHRKQIDAGAEACWLWACGLMYANRQQARDGFIPERAIAVLYPLTTKQRVRLVARLVEVGLWLKVPGGYQIHQFIFWNRSKEQVESDRATGRARAAKSYANRKAPPAVSSPEEDPKSAPKIPDSSGVEWSGDGVGVGVDPEAGTQIGSPRARADPSDQPPKSPKNLAESLLLPIEARAKYTEQNRHLAEWLQPEAWPEVQAVVVAMHAANRGRGAPKAGRYGTDSGIRRAVELYAAGFSQAELVEACGAVVKTAWWSEGGSGKSLGALTVEVVRRALTPPGATEHRARNGKEAVDQPPYHGHAKPLVETGPVVPPTEVKALLGKVLGNRP